MDVDHVFIFSRGILEVKDIANFINNEFLFWVQPSTSADGMQGIIIMLTLIITY